MGTSASKNKTGQIPRAHGLGEKGNQRVIPDQAILASVNTPKYYIFNLTVKM